MAPDELRAIQKDFDASRSLNHSDAELALRQTVRRLAEEVGRCWRTRAAVLSALGCSTLPLDASDDLTVATLREAERARCREALARAASREALELSGALTLARNLADVRGEVLSTVTEALGLPAHASAEEILAAMARRPEAP